MSGSNYQPGQVLTAAQLNSSFDSKTDNENAQITGGSITGIQNLEISGTNDSTSPTTGALVVAGGVGISLDVQVGGKVTSESDVIVNGEDDSTSLTTGALVVAGGAAVGKSLNVGGSANISGALAVALQVSAQQTTDSTSSSTGALVVAGGVGIAKTLNVGGSASIGGNLGVTGILSVTGAANLAGALTVTNATQSTSSSTGAVIVAGGLGVAKNANVGGALTVTGAISSPSGGIQNTPIGDGTANEGFFTLLSASSASSVTNNTPSTSPTTGAFIVTGGVGVGGALNVGGALVAAGNASLNGLVYGRTNPNLLSNSTGEFANIGWTGTNFSGSNDTTGARGTQFSNAAALSAAASDVSSNIPVGAGVAMTLSADLMTTGVTNGALTATLTAFNSSGASLGAVCSITLANGASYTRVNASGTTPANTAYVQVSKAITGATVAASALGAAFRRIKVEMGSFATLYSQEASFSATSAMTTTNPTIAAGPLTFADGTQQYSAPVGKNYVVDGNFDYWIASSVSLPTGVTNAAASPLYIAYTGVGGTCTISYSSFALGAEPVGVTSPLNYFYKHTQTAAATSNPTINHRIESVRTLQGRSATFSCWLWTDSGTVTIPSVQLIQYFGTGGSPSATVTNSSSVNWTLTTTPQRFSVRFDLPSIVGKTLGTNGNDFLQISIPFPTGSTFTVNTAQWQLEQCSPSAPAIGAPTAFEYRGLQAETARVQRFYESAISTVQSPVAGTTLSTVAFKVKKRIIPSMSYTFGYSNSTTGQVVANDVAGGYIQITATAAGGYANASWVADARL